ncbi:relaxase/mobilization nuclease domain-containing protein, partial [Draconibacterium sp.]|nr:relaxase/mobilization nuclease domain-containing protein [Draconibacterium sp.]
GILNTQFVIARHYDEEHPHIHIVLNRIDNHGKTISNKNDRYRSEKICKELTRKYNLYFAKGKENVKIQRLNEPNKTRYEIYYSLKKIVGTCRSWQELEARLNKEGIEIRYKFLGKTDVVQGISFTKNNLKFNGSKVDRQFSYSKIDFQLNKNLLEFLQQNSSNKHSPIDYSKVARMGANLIKPKFEEQREKDYPKLKPQKKKRRGYRM